MITLTNKSYKEVIDTLEYLSMFLNNNPSSLFIIYSYIDRPTLFNRIFIDYTSCSKDFAIDFKIIQDGIIRKIFPISPLFKIIQIK